MKSKFDRGMVIKSHFPDYANHDKYFVFMGISGDNVTAYGFFISSTPESLAYSNQDIMKLQIKIPPGSYPYLDKPKPSYINCYEYYEMPFKELVDLLIQTPSKICDPPLSQDHHDQILKAVRSNDTFEDVEADILADKLVLPPIP